MSTPLKTHKETSRGITRAMTVLFIKNGLFRTNARIRTENPKFDGEEMRTLGRWTDEGR
jgi:hypothetical protein